MFSDRIKELRKEKVLTQVELAQILGVSKGTVAMWETGKRRPSFEALEAMSELFDKRMDYILGYSEDGYSTNMTEEDIDQIGRWKMENDYYETMKRYLRLDSYGKIAVEQLIIAEMQRCVAQKSDVSIEDVELTIRLKDNTLEGGESMKEEGHITRGLKVLGESYTTQTIDMENCIYKDLGNGIDFEISYSHYMGYRIYVWLGRRIIVENTEIVKLNDLKETMDALELKYKDIDAEEFEKEVVEKFWGKSSRASTSEG